MKRDDAEFMERISLDLETRRMACKILDVDETADRNLLFTHPQYCWHRRDGQERADMEMVQRHNTTRYENAHRANVVEFLRE